MRRWWIAGLLVGLGCLGMAQGNTDAAGRLDWTALGYRGDPIKWGGRKLP